jgi:transposase
MMFNNRRNASWEWRRIPMIVGDRIATRYDKLAANYLAFIKLASIRIWLHAYESAP